MEIKEDAEKIKDRHARGHEQKNTLRVGVSEVGDLLRHVIMSYLQTVGSGMLVPLEWETDLGTELWSELCGLVFPGGYGLNPVQKLTNVDLFKSIHNLKFSRPRDG